MMKLLAGWIALLVLPAMGFHLSLPQGTRISKTKSQLAVQRITTHQITKSSSRQTTKLSMNDIASSSVDFISNLDLINNGFNVATFGPQPFWLLMCLLPNFALTSKLMKPWTTIIFFALVHLVIVFASISQPDGTAPITEVVFLLLLLLLLLK